MISTQQACNERLSTAHKYKMHALPSQLPNKLDGVAQAVHQNHRLPPFTVWLLNFPLSQGQAACLPSGNTSNGGTRKGGESRVTTTSDSSPPLYSLSRTHRSTSRTLKVAAAVCYNNISSKSLVVLLLVAVLCWCWPHHCHIHHWRLYRDSRQHTHTLSLTPHTGALTHLPTTSSARQATAGR